MGERRITTGAMPYADGSGFAVKIEIHENEMGVNLRTDIYIDPVNWPEVRDAVENAISAYRTIKGPAMAERAGGEPSP